MFSPKNIFFLYNNTDYEKRKEIAFYDYCEEFDFCFPHYEIKLLDYLYF